MNYYVRLVQGKGLISGLIEIHSADWPSHAELLETTDQARDQTFSSRYPDGVKYRGYNDYPVVRDCWYAAPPGTAKAAWAVMETIIGSAYDVRDIFGISADKDWHTDGRYICSEGVAYAFEKSGNPLFNPDEEVRRIIPAHFLLPTQLKFYKVVIH